MDGGREEEKRRECAKGKVSKEKKTEPNSDTKMLKCFAHIMIRCVFVQV